MIATMEKVNAQVLDYEQGSSEWLEARLGLISASRFKEVVARTARGEYTKKRADYLADLVGERHGQVVDRFVSKEMLWGTETEDLARFAYERATDTVVEQIGMFKHPTLPIAASPDGLVGEDGGLEIKNRKLANHLYSLHTGEVPDEFIDQIDGCIWLSDREWWDYCSYAPELVPNAQLFIKRVYRNEERIRKLVGELIKFNSEVELEVSFVRDYRRPNHA